MASVNEGAKIQLVSSKKQIPNKFKNGNLDYKKNRKFVVLCFFEMWNRIT